MACKIIYTRSSDGDVNVSEINYVKAANGNRSLLFDKINSNIKNSVSAFSIYNIVNTKRFKDWYGDAVKDENNEPVIDIQDGKIFVTNGLETKILSNKIEDTFFAKLNDKFKGKLVYAMSGTGKTYASKLSNKVIDADDIMYQMLNVTPTSFIRTWSKMSDADKKSFNVKLLKKLRTLTNNGYTVLTPRKSFATHADYVILPDTGERIINDVLNEDRENPYLITEEEVNKQIKELKDGGDIASMLTLNESEYLSDILYNEKHAEHVQEIIEIKLSNLLIEYLKPFGVKFEAIDRLAEKGITVQYAIDTLNKFVQYVKGEESEQAIPDAAGHMIVELIGRDHAMIKSMKSKIERGLWKNKEEISFEMDGKVYKTIKTIDHYKILKENLSKYSEYQNEDGSVNEDKLLLHAVGLVISDSLKKQSKIQNKSLLKKALEIVQAIIDKLFGGDLDNASKNSVIFSQFSLKQLSDYISANVLLNNTRFLNTSLPSDYKLMTYEEMIEKSELFNFIHSKLKDDFLIGGSAAYRKQGTTYRPKDELVHDIDYNVPIENIDTWEQIILEKFPSAIPAHDAWQSDDGSLTYAYYVPTGEGVEIISHEIVPRGKNDFRAINIKTNTPNGDDYIAVDFFVVPGKKKPFLKEERLIRWDTSFIAKLAEYGRKKDLIDFRLFELYDEKYRVPFINESKPFTFISTNEIDTKALYNREVKISDVEYVAGFRNKDGSRKKFTNYNSTLSLVKEYNNSHNDYKAKLIKVLGEKGDNRTYWAVKLELKYNSDNVLDSLFENKKQQKASKILENLSKSNHPLNKLAATLIPYLEKINPNVNIYRTDSLHTFTDSKGNVHEASGAYYPIDSLVPDGIPENNSIGIKEGVRKPEVVLLHEILHSLTHYALKDPSNKAIMDDFIKAYDFVKIFYSGYATENLDEFIVGLFTDAELIKRMQRLAPLRLGKTRIKDYKNLLEQLFDYILSLFKFKKKDNIYNQAFNVATHILDAATNKPITADYLAKTFYSDFNSEIQDSINNHYQNIDSTSPLFNKLNQINLTALQTKYPNVNFKELIYKNKEKLEIKFYEDKFEDLLDSIQNKELPKEIKDILNYKQTFKKNLSLEKMLNLFEKSDDTILKYFDVKDEKIKRILLTSLNESLLGRGRSNELALLSDSNFMTLAINNPDKMMDDNVLTSFAMLLQYFSIKSDGDLNKAYDDLVNFIQINLIKNINESNPQAMNEALEDYELNTIFDYQKAKSQELVADALLDENQLVTLNTKELIKKRREGGFLDKKINAEITDLESILFDLNTEIFPDEFSKSVITSVESQLQKLKLMKEVGKVITNAEVEGKMAINFAKFHGLMVAAVASEFMIPGGGLISGALRLFGVLPSVDVKQESYNKLKKAVEAEVFINKKDALGEDKKYLYDLTNVELNDIIKDAEKIIEDYAYAEDPFMTEEATNLIKAAEVLIADETIFDLLEDFTVVEDLYEGTDEELANLKSLIESGLDFDESNLLIARDLILSNVGLLSKFNKQYQEFDYNKIDDSDYDYYEDDLDNIQYKYITSDFGELNPFKLVELLEIAFSDRWDAKYKKEQVKELLDNYFPLNSNELIEIYQNNGAKAFLDVLDSLLYDNYDTNILMLSISQVISNSGPGFNYRLSDLPDSIIKKDISKLYEKYVNSDLTEEQKIKSFKEEINTLYFSKYHDTYIKNFTKTYLNNLKNELGLDKFKTFLEYDINNNNKFLLGLLNNDFSTLFDLISYNEIVKKYDKLKNTYNEFHYDNDFDSLETLDRFTQDNFYGFVFNKLNKKLFNQTDEKGNYVIGDLFKRNSFKQILETIESVTSTLKLNVIYSDFKYKRNNLSNLEFEILPDAQAAMYDDYIEDDVELHKFNIYDKTTNKKLFTKIINTEKYDVFNFIYDFLESINYEETASSFYNNIDKEVEIVEILKSVDYEGIYKKVNATYKKNETETNNNDLFIEAINEYYSGPQIQSKKLYGFNMTNKPIHNTTASTKSLTKILDSLSNRFGIKYKFVNNPNGKWAGRYLPNGVIEINEAYIHQYPDTPFHEFFHPFLDVIESQNKQLFENLKREINDILASNDSPELKAKLKRILNNSEYIDKDGNLTNFGYKEAITELVGSYALQMHNQEWRRRQKEKNPDREVKEWKSVSGTRISEKRMNKNKSLMQKLFDYVRRIITNVLKDKDTYSDTEGFVAAQDMPVIPSQLNPNMTLSDLGYLMGVDTARPVRLDLETSFDKKIQYKEIDTFQLDTTKFNGPEYSTQQRKLVEKYNENIKNLLPGKIDVEVSKLSDPLKRKLLALKGETVPLYRKLPDARGRNYVENRVSMNQDLKFLAMGRKTKEEIEEMENTPKSILGRKYGTILHEINENILRELLAQDVQVDLKANGFDWANEYFEKVFQNSDFYKNYIKDIHSNNSPFDYNMTHDGIITSDGTTDYNELVKSMLRLYHEVYVEQDIVNKELSEKQNKEVKHKPIFLFERPLYDEEADEAGTTDFMVFFSDGTALIYDHKFISFPLEKKSLKDSKLSVDEVYKIRAQQGLSTTRNKNNNWYYSISDDYEEKLYRWKQESYDMQLSRYSDMLVKKYGIKRIRQARIIPTAVKYSTVSQGAGKPRKLDAEKSKVQFLMTGEHIHRLLKQIPATSEKTGDEALDKFISNLESSRKKLKKILSKKGWDNNPTLTARYNKILNAINSLKVDRNVNSIIENIVALVDDVKTRLIEPEFLEDGSLNPKYINLEDVNELKAEINLYGGFMEATKNIIKKVDKDNKVEAENFNLKVGLAMAGLKDVEIKVKQRAIQILSNINLRNEFMSEERFLSYTQQADISQIDRWMSHLSNVNHPLVNMFKQLLDKIAYNRIQAEKQLEKEIRIVNDDLKSWANSNGMNIYQAYKKLLNSDKNLISKYNSQYYKDLQERREEINKQNTNWFKNNFKRSRAQERSFQEWKKKNRLVMEKKYKGKQLDDEWNKWLDDNDITYNNGDNKAWYRSYVGITPKNEEQYLSDGYRYILSNKPLLNFYEFYRDKNMEFNSKVDFKIKANFVPEIHKKMIDTILQDGMGNTVMGMNAFKTIKENWKYRETDDRINLKDDEKEIPIMFMDSINVDNKSIDLAQSMLLFGTYVNEYQGLKELEHIAKTIREMISKTDLVKTNMGKKEGIEGTFDFETISKENKNILALFDNMVNYYVYGEKMSAKLLKSDMPPQAAKIISKLIELNSKKNIAFNFLSAAGGHIGAAAQLQSIAKKGKYFTQKQLRDARMKHAKYNKEIIFATEYFRPQQDDLRYEKAQEINSSYLVNKYTRGGAFWLQRKSDDMIEHVIMGAMLQNYGINPITGKADSLTSLKKFFKDHPKYGSDYEWKSLMEMIDMSGEEPVIINHHTNEKIDEKVFMSFRRKVKDVAAKSKGNMSGEDIAAYKTTLLGQTVMQFRGWIPAMLRHRLKKQQYDVSSEEFEVGTWRAAFEIVRAGALKAFGEFAMQTMFGRLANRKFDFAYNSKVLDEKFALWIDDNQGDFAEMMRKYDLDPNNEEDVEKAKVLLKEEFVKEYISGIKSLAKEVQLYLALYAAMLLFGYGSGDDERKQNPIVKGTINLIERAMLEIGFFIPGLDFATTGNFEMKKMLDKSPIPAMDIITSAMGFIQNTAGETIDILSGISPFENEKYVFLEMPDEPFGDPFYMDVKKDKKSLFYYTRDFVPGAKGISKTVGMFNTTEESDTIWDWITNSRVYKR